MLVALIGFAGTGLADTGTDGPQFSVVVDEEASDDAVWQGEAWTIVATVTNRGDEVGTQEVVVEFGDETTVPRPGDQLLDLGLSLPGPDVREVTLEPGESRTLELSPTVPQRVQPGPATATVRTLDDAASLEGTVGDASVDVDPVVADRAGWSKVVVRLQALTLEGLEDPERALKAHAEASQADLLELAERSQALEVLNTFWLANTALLEVDHDANGLLLASTADHVRWIHENFQMAPMGETIEPTATTTSSGDTTWGLSEINAPGVWDQYGTQGSGARVAVLDTGIDNDHEDLSLYNDPNDGIPITGWAEFDDDGNIDQTTVPHDPNGHGTHVSGTVAGGDASGTHIGVAPDVELFHGKVLDPSGTFAQVVAGMEWAAEQEADVTSMSLGASGYDPHDIEPIRASHALGTYVVAAIGNDGEGTSGSPGNVFDSLAVGASNADHDIAEFSGGEEIVTDDAWGDDAPDDWPASYIVPDLAAPGVEVLSSLPDGGYGYGQGTSMATPHVSGAVALLLSVHDHLTVEDVEEALLASTWKPAGEPSQPDTRYGEGIIDAQAALDYASEQLTGFEVTVTETNSPVTEGELLNATVAVHNGGDAPASQTVHLEDFQGTTVDAREDVALAAGESTSFNLTWATEDGDAGYADIVAASEDLDTDELVRIFDDSGACAPRHHVNIVGDYAFTPANGVTRGEGTAEDPYVIERWCIDAEDHTSAVFLDSTTAHVEVRDNEVRGSYSGIVLSDAENVRVRNNTAEANEVRGISVSHSAGTSVEDNTVRDNGWTGVTVWSSSPSTTVRDNEVTGNANNGVFLGSDGNTVEGNLAENNGQNGISLGTGSDENTVRDNEVQNSDKHGIFVDGADNEVDANTVTGNDWQGVITWDEASGTSITDNEITGNAETGLWMNSLRNLVEGNTIEDNGYHGLSLGSGSGETVVRHNEIASNVQDGVWIDSTSNQIRDNEVLANGDDGLVLSSGATGNEVTANRIAEHPDNGIWANSADDRILENTVEDNDDGLVLSSDATGLAVRGNAFTGNADDGIWLYGDENLVEDNDVEDNAGTGVGFSSGAEGNAVTWNRIAGNGWGISVFETSDVTIERNEILRNENDGLSANDLDEPLDVTDNAWGVLTGPSGGVEDCATGAVADGDGDSIGTDNAEVCFDPWLSPWFVVSITETNAPVLPGQDLEVTVEVENTWEAPDTQTIRLEGFGDETVDRIEGLTLDGGETVTRTLVWETGTGDWGISDVTVASESHADDAQVTVLPDPLAG